MKIDLHTRSFNDAHMLPFFFRHYDPIVDSFYVYDDGSTDGTVEQLAGRPKVVVRPRPPYADPHSHVRSSQLLMDSTWKESRGRADWVIVTDIDEHLHHPDLFGYLRSCRDDGVTLVPALGFQMLAADFPAPNVELSRTVTRGAPAPVMSKLSLFSPDAILETNFAPGRHAADPSGRVLLPARDELLLLHYKYLGFEQTHRRHEAYRRRLRKTDVAKGWGHKYGWSRQELRRDWAELESRAVEVLDCGLDLDLAHPGPRWWSGLTRAGATG
jgi:hypothetical protein